MKKENKQRLGWVVGGILGLAAFAAADKLIGFESFNFWLRKLISGGCVILGGFMGQKIASKIGSTETATTR